MFAFTCRAHRCRLQRSGGRRNSFCYYVSRHWHKSCINPCERDLNANYDRFLKNDSYKPRKDYFYCRFRVLFVSNCSRLSYFVESYCHMSTWERSKQQYIKDFFLFLLSVLKNLLVNWQSETHVFGYVLSFFVKSTVGNLKNPIWTDSQNLVQQYKKEKSCFLLPAQQSQAQKTRYELSPKILSNSTKEKSPASYCRGNSRKSK